MLTERDVAVLKAVARYYVLSRVHIQRLCFPDDQSGRSTRRRLQMLVSEKYLNRTAAPIYNPAGGSPWPAYFPAKRGCMMLAELLQDDHYELVPIQSPNPQHLLHWLAITDTHLVLDTCVKKHADLQLTGWINEWDIVNISESDPHKRFRLYSLLRDHPRLVCVPDAALLLEKDNHRKVFYLELDRNTTGSKHFAASKTPGYAELFQQQRHRRHFPQTTVDKFNILVVTTSDYRRDSLRKAVAPMPGADLWKFAAINDLTEESFLHGEVFYPCNGAAHSLVRPQASKPISDCTIVNNNTGNNTQPGGQLAAAIAVGEPKELHT